MAIDYQQTDNAGTAGAIAACSGATITTANANRTAVAGGAAGSTPATLGGGNFDSGQSRALLFFEITPEAGATWGAGDWTVRVNVTTAQANVTWSETHICRLNSSDVSQATIGSLTGQTTSMATTGVKTHTVSGSSQTPGAGDKVYIVIVLAAGANNRSIAVTPDQLITSPFTAASGQLNQKSVSAAYVGTASYLRGIGKYPSATAVCQGSVGKVMDKFLSLSVQGILASGVGAVFLYPRKFVHLVFRMRKS